MLSSYSSDDTIFVQIASYRDPELQHTLQDLFKKAKRPENIFVGICHQYDMKDGTDKHLFEVPFPRQDQIRIDEMDYREAKLCLARNRAQELYKGEKWVMQIDAHMRFRESWDEIIVTDIKKINDGKRILFTGVPQHYNPVNNITYFPEETSLIGINGTRERGIVMLPNFQSKFKRVFSAEFCLNSASNSVGLL